MTRTVIGIAGFARSGKDSLADALINNHFVDSKRSFAAPLKSAVNAIYKWNDRHANGDLKEVQTVAMASIGFICDVIYEHFNGYASIIDTDSFELALRWVEICKKHGVTDGVEGMGGLVKFELSPRQAYQWFGTDLMRKNVSPNIWLDLALKGDGSIVIPDVRFDNEAEAVRTAEPLGGSLLIHVEREGVQGKVNAHVSEAGVIRKAGDVVLVNDGTLEQLHAAGCYIVSRHKMNQLPFNSFGPTSYSAKQLAEHYEFNSDIDSVVNV